MRTHRSRLLGAFGSTVLIVSLSACGSDSDPARQADSTATPQDDSDDVVASDSNPLVLGFEVSGPAGTVIETSTVAMADDTAQPALDQTWTLSGEPKWQLFTTFINGAEITLEVTEGGPATIKSFRGNYEDVDDPMAGYVVSEELSTLELAPGKSSVLTLP